MVPIADTRHQCPECLVNAEDGNEYSIRIVLQTNHLQDVLRHIDIAEHVINLFLSNHCQAKVRDHDILQRRIAIESNIDLAPDR